MWRDGVLVRVGELLHPAWGPEHCRRVYALCRQIVEAEKLDADDDILFAAVWLHDIGTFGPYSCRSAGGPPECAALGAEEMLPEVGFPEEKLPTTLRIIAEHSFEGDDRDTVEAKVLRDADMLEFLGAIGLVRLLSIVEQEDWVPDPRTAISLAIQFNQDLPDKFFFAASRRIAETRVTEAMEFIAALSAETAELQVI
jgi:uncharacterized protein